MHVTISVWVETDEDKIAQAMPHHNVVVLVLLVPKLKLHIYLEEGTYHKRLSQVRGPNTNDMKK